MHPAPSILLFTVLSGAGYGLLFLLGLLGVADLAALGVALLLIAAGLLASLLHLGRPERAWRALSQWRASWLSREGVAALVTFAPALGFALTGAPALGLLAAFGAAATVYCTAMIYASLKPVRQWSMPLVPVVYASAALASGATLMVALEAPRFGPPGATLLLLAAALAKLAYWQAIDRLAPAVRTAAAIGLPQASARLLDPPNEEQNFLLQEMGFAVARKHARKLRRIAFLLAFAVPAAGVWLGPAAAVLAALSCLAGLAVERWLFFAEARHTVMLYYGTPTA